MSVRLRVVVAALALLVGTLCALFATDVLRWRDRMAWGDTRFEAGSTESGLWSLPQPFLLDTSRSVLALGDDRTYRMAVREFVLGRPREEHFSDAEQISQRGRAQEELAALVEGGQDAKRRAAAANLIGVLGFANAAIDPQQASTYLSAAITSFRQAIELDPSNADAKYNLELALIRLPDAKRSAGQNPSSNTQSGTGSGAGAGRSGSGY
jgi:TPR repeat